MAENHFDLADSLISKADALGVNYGIWYAGDTPRKARHDLEIKRNAAVAEATRPSQLLTPIGLGGDKKAPTTDPFARYAADPSGAQQLTPLPNVDPTAAQLTAPNAYAVSQPYPTTVPGDNDARAPGQYAWPAGGGCRRPIRVRCGWPGGRWPRATSVAPASALRRPRPCT